MLLQGSLQPAAHPWSQAYRARQASCFPFGLESVICSLPGIRPVDDMAHPSLSPPPVIPVQQFARLCSSQNTETKQKNQPKTNKPLKVTETFITALLWLESVVPQLLGWQQAGGSKHHFYCQRKPAVSTRHRFRATTCSLAGRCCQGPTKSLLRMIKMSLLLLHCYFCCFADVISDLGSRLVLTGITHLKPTKNMDNHTSYRPDPQQCWGTEASFWNRKALLLWFVLFSFYF